MRSAENGLHFADRGIQYRFNTKGEMRTISRLWSALAFALPLPMCCRGDLIAEFVAYRNNGELAAAENNEKASNA